VFPIIAANGIGLNVHEFLLTSFGIPNGDVHYPKVYLYNRLCGDLTPGGSGTVRVEAASEV